MNNIPIQCEAALQNMQTRTKKLSITILSLSAFIIVTTEFILIGLLPTLTRDLEISIPAAGQLVTVFAITVVFAGPPLTALFSKYERRALFMWILIAFTMSNIAVAIAPNYWSIMIARILPAALLPVFWGIGSDAATQIAGKEYAGKAISKVYFGVTAALLLGLPLGTVLSDSISWRGTFWVLSLLSLLMAVLVVVFMPKLPAGPQDNIKKQILILSNKFFLANLLLSLVIFTAMFAAYTYLAEMLENAKSVNPAHVGWWLMAFGTVGLIGNYLAGYLADKSIIKANVLFCLLLALGAASSILFSEQPIIFAISLIAWGIAHTALFPLGQIRVLNAAKGGKALAGTLNISACNCGIAIGASLGGWIINISGINAAIIGASILIIICGLASPLVEFMRPNATQGVEYK
ncbi:TPA: MFS transporter [Providencia rettgeri]